MLKTTEAEKKRNENSLRSLWDNTKSTSTQVLRISEEEEEVSEKICKEIIVENSLI